MGDDNTRYRWDSGMPRWKAWLNPLSAIAIVLLLAVLFFRPNGSDPDREPTTSCPEDRQNTETREYPVGTHSVLTRTTTVCR